ncbi:MAG: ferrous iron transporter B [Planctomycetota bacterium]|nr:MAG: ferrous iron transporter B [Planctomycetota bacterium]
MNAATLARTLAEIKGKSPTVALVGSPNSGKTTLFNALTGLRAKTGNYPGVTVDRKVGIAKTPAGLVRVVDLPGTYSLHAISQDESVAVQILKGEMVGEEKPDGVLVVADATTLDRSLPFIAEVLHLGLPSCLVLTMIDELKARGGDIDLARLGGELGIPIVGIVGNRGIGIDDLRARIADLAQWSEPRNLPQEDTESRFAWADGILQRVTRSRPRSSRLTQALDRILLHPILGPLVFLAFLAAFFQSIFSYAAPAMDFMAGLMDQSADWLLANLPAGMLTDLLADGIVRGVGAVLVFIPQIALLFAVIIFMESCGYLARGAFVVDRLLGWAGLEGRCFISLLSSYACAVPGILATRSIPSPRDRLATILAAPFTTCSARLPVYALLVGTFISREKVLGPFTWQGMTLMGLYFLGGFTALLSAALFKKGMLRGATLPFYLELPPYRFPSLKLVTVQVLRRIKLFLRRAGTVILGASVLLWILLNFPQPEEVDGRAPEPQTVLESSYAAQAGQALEPLFAPMGFDWRINVGLLGSLAAREVLVSTMAQVYAYEGGEEDAEGFGKMLRARNPETGEPRLKRASAMALLVFFVFALQCISTLAVIRRETNSWRWPAFAFTYSFAIAWLGAWWTYLLLS